MSNEKRLKEINTLLENKNLTNKERIVLLNELKGIYQDFINTYDVKFTTLDNFSEIDLVKKLGFDKEKMKDGMLDFYILTKKEITRIENEIKSLEQ